jgi:heme o synthase
MNDLPQVGITRHIRLSLTVAKIPLCLLVSFSALFGYVFAAEDLVMEAFYVFAAVFLLSCGAASLNSYQERYADGLMSRTRKRPLVQGQLPAGLAALQSIFLLSAGLVGLFLLAGLPAFLAGFIGVFLYNIIYTKLKPLTLYAIVPGAVCGAIPPYIGWLAAGGAPFSVRAFLPVLLLFFWQIPHFFLVLLRHKPDYTGNVAPNMLSYLPEQALRRIFLPWVAALVTTMITFSVVPSMLGSWERFIIVGNGVILLGVFYYQMLCSSQPDYTLLFRHLNLSLFLLMLIICVGGSKLI